MLFDLYPTADWPTPRPFSSNHENGAQESIEKADEAAMTDPAQACGNCKWWSDKGADYLRACLYRPQVLPSWVEELSGDNMMFDHDGKDCPTWQPK